MESTIIYTFAAILLVSLVSLIGVIALALHARTLKKYIGVLVGLAAGALLGDAFVHLIPESFEEIGNEQLFALTVLVGLSFFFILEKAFRWHHAHHGHEEEHDGHECFEKNSEHGHLAPLVIVADGIHNLVDGALIAASFIISPALGIATTIAVFLHEIPQEIADFGLLLHAGLSRAKALLFNFLSALTALIGALLVFVTQSSFELSAPLLAAFTAGGFIYIAAADLVPEIQKTKGAVTSLLQILAFVIGIALMFALTILETSH